MIKRTFNRLKKKTFSKKNKRTLAAKKLEKLYQAALALQKEDKKKQRQYYNRNGFYSPKMKEVRNQISLSGTLQPFVWHKEIPNLVKFIRDVLNPQHERSIKSTNKEDLQHYLTIMYKIDTICGDFFLYIHFGNGLCPMIFRLAELEGITLDPIAHKALYGEESAKS